MFKMAKKKPFHYTVTDCFSDGTPMKKPVWEYPLPEEIQKKCCPIIAEILMAK
jgi:hypothetical protein